MRRVVLVVLAYLAGAWLVLGFASWLRGVLALPRLFSTLLALGLLAGLPLAAFFAWRYPDLGLEAGASAEGEASSGRGGGPSDAR